MSISFSRHYSKFGRQDAAGATPTCLSRSHHRRAQKHSQKNITSKNSAEQVGGQGAAIPSRTPPRVLHNHTLYIPFLHISSLSIASAPLAVCDHFFVPFAHPLFPLIPGNSPSNHGRSLPPLSSDLLRAPPVVLHQPSTHHPGLPQLHLAFYCTNCCLRLNTINYLFSFIWVWKREK